MIPPILTARTRNSHHVRALTIFAICAGWIVLFIMMCGTAGAITYDSDSGINDINTVNCSTWSTLLSNNDSTVTCDINVNSGALNLSNATIRMADEKYIRVKSDAIMNVTDGSTITHDSSDDYYYFNYESGSRGKLNDSTVEYSYKLDISTVNNVTITDCTIRNNLNQGIYLTSSSGYVNISGCTIHNNHEHGIYLNSASGHVNIINSTVSDASDYGIYIQNSNYCNLIENNITDSGDDGIFVQNGENIILRANNLTRNRDGIRLDSCPNSNLASNTVVDSSRYGINITSSQNCILRSNDMINSTDYNLYVTGNYDQDIDTSNTVNSGLVYYNYTDNGTITDPNIGHVTIVDCTDLWFTGCMVHNGDGIRIIGSSSNVSIRGSTIENNTVYGINLESTSWNNITSVIIENNTKQGIYLVDSSNNTINDSDILNNSNYGVHSEGLSSYNHVSYNNITNNTQGGICLDGSGHNDITYNNVSENRGSGGICIGEYHYSSESTQNTLHNNTILSNNATGIGVYTNNNHLSNNTISTLSGHYALKVSYIRNSFYNYIWRNNTANGEQINYYYDEHDKITELADKIIENKYLSAHNVSNVGKITLIDCTNLIVRDSELSNNSLSSSYGIFLWNSDNNNLTGNTLSNNNDGIRLYNSSNNNFTDLQTTNPSNQYGAFLSDSDHNSITDSSLAATNSHGLWISSSEHTTLINIEISSVDSSGLSTIGAHYTNITNATIVTTETDGASLTSSDHVTIKESSITANNTGISFTNSNYTYIINTTFNSEDGIYMSESHWGNLTNNTIDATLRGIFLTTSRDHNLTINNITNYTITGILLEEYSTNNTMIGNDLTWDGSEFDITLNDSNDCVIANKESMTANYTFYLTGNTSLCTLDTVFNKTKVGYEDDSNLTLMWRIDVLCWDNYHKEAIMSNLTVQYSDLSDANGSLCWEGEISAGTAADPGVQGGRLSGNMFDYWGPPTSSDNWLPIIEYKENVTGKTTYQPMNCTAISKWDVLYGMIRTYRNVTATITEPGVTIRVDTGYTPNGKCYYCHVDKYVFINTKHWTMYENNVTEGKEYTPGRCVDCHNEKDSIAIPHTNDESGKDLLYYPSPQLCYTGRTGELDCHSASAASGLDQENEFNMTTHHPLGDGNLSCKACHDNHGTDYDSDLLRKYYADSDLITYDSANFALCYVCHLEEKIVAMMHESGGNDKSRHLQNYSNQTNFRDEYNDWSPFCGGFQNVHSPQLESFGVHRKYSCYDCHNPHGAVDPAMTRYKLNYTYITNLTPPGVEYEFGDWANQTVLVNQSDWSNSTLNEGGAVYAGRGCGVFGCHNSYRRNYFVYRTFVNYTPAGGAGCLECHDNNASAYNETPIRPIVNLTAIKLAMHSNLSGAFRTGSVDLPGTTRTFNEWLTYRGYTAKQIANITEDNAICWACHCTNGTPPNPYFHPDRALNPYKCAKCHGPLKGQPPHTQELVAAIDNHGPTTKGAESILIQTDVGNGGSCGDCHAPSVLPDDKIDNPSDPNDNLKVWKWNGGWIPYDEESRSTMGDVSHYGLNRSQGMDILGNNSPNVLCNTSDCLYCHCNETNGTIWGNATYIADNMYGADTSNISECYTYCHVRFGWVDSVNESTLTHFHNKSIYAGGGPNCTLCHDIGSKYGVQSLVNATAIAEGIHGNMLNNTLVHEGYGMDNRSNPCWGCHNSDGTIPEGMGDRNGITDLNDDGVITADELPYTCEDCHARSDAWNSATGEGHTWESASDPYLGMNRLPPVIIDHYPNATLVKTNVYSSNGGCKDCHNNSIDPDHGDTAYKILGNTIFSNVSHYGTTSDLLTPTRKCRYCHNDTTTNVTFYGNAIQNQHGNFTNESNPDDGCYSCHANNETPVDFHNMNFENIPGGLSCLNCHDSNGMAARRRINETVYEGAIHARMNNATTGPNGTNQSCWVCHFPEGLGMDNHSNRQVPAYHCYYCHNKAGGPFSNVSDAPEVHNHFKSGTNISAYWGRPTDSDSCMGCHNQSEMFYPFTENDIYRTNFSITSHYGNNRTDIVNLFNENDPKNYCGYCHDNLSTVFVEQQSMKKVKHFQSQTCDECHGKGRLHNSTLTRAGGSDGNCTNCHATYGGKPGVEKYKINVTAMNLGVHANVNSNMTDIAESKTNDKNNSKCWGCHVPDGAWPEEGHKGTFNNDAYLCYECHNSSAKAYDNVSSATAVYNHFKNGDNISACTDAESDSESCGYGCHNLTSMKVPGFEGVTGNTSYRVNLSQASHYTWNRTDIVTDNISDCTWCHRNSSNEFIDIFERNGAPNYTENIPHAENLNSCILKDCHRSGRIHDSNLTIPTWEWGAECKDCHFGLTGSIYYVNESMFDASVHGTVNCTDCHINESSSHPVEEYYWKWCECCHSYQTDPTNESDRHNVTTTPSTYLVEGTNVLNITDCTTCHNATAYNATVDYYTTIDTTNECRYCHAYPDKGNRTSQEWY